MGASLLSENYDFISIDHQSENDLGQFGLIFKKQFKKMINLDDWHNIPPCIMKCFDMIVDFIELSDKQIQTLYNKNGRNLFKTNDRFLKFE